MFNKIVLYFIILTTVIVYSVSASTPQPPDIPRDYIVDLAGIFTKDTQHQLNTLLQDLERRTTAQVLVLTVQSLDGQSIEEFAFNTKEKWKLGQKGKDNGVLIVVAVKDRKYRFEVGYGLESVLPDSMAGTIGREYMVPNFKKGDYSIGISQAINALTNELYEIVNRKTTGAARIQDYHIDHEVPINIKGTLLMVLLLVPFFYIFVRCPIEKNKQELKELWTGGGDGGFGSSGFGGGGFGGFGGGSFGGGGGGSGGGGGASGGW